MSNQFKAIIDFKCPKCEEGSLFKDKKRYSFNISNNMNSKCPHCNQDFIIEPGFEFGAMYISYALNVIYFALATLFTNLFLNPDNLYHYVYIDIAIVILALPYTMKLSKSLNIHLMGGIKKN